MLYALLRVPDLTAEQRISVQRDLAAVRAKQVESNFGDQRGYAEMQAVQARAGNWFACSWTPAT